MNLNPKPSNRNDNGTGSDIRKARWPISLMLGLLLLASYQFMLIPIAQSATRYRGLRFFYNEVATVDLVLLTTLFVFVPALAISTVRNRRSARLQVAAGWLLLALFFATNIVAAWYIA